MAQHCMPIAETIGRETVMEHLPKPEKSLITAILFCLFLVTGQSSFP